MVIGCVGRKLRALFWKRFTQNFLEKSCFYLWRYVWESERCWNSKNGQHVTFSKLSRGPKLHKEMILKSSRHHIHCYCRKRELLVNFHIFKEIYSIWSNWSKKMLFTEPTVEPSGAREKNENSSQRKLCFSVTLQDRRYRRNQTGKSHDAPIHF